MDADLIIFYLFFVFLYADQQVAICIVINVADKNWSRYAAHIGQLHAKLFEQHKEVYN